MRWTNLLIAPAMLLSGCGGAAQRTPLPTPDMRPVVERWLLRNCVVGEKGIPEAELKQAGGRAEPWLIEAFHQGPDAEKLRLNREAATQRYERLQAFLQRDPDPGLDKDDAVRLQAVTREQYVRQAEDNFALAYKAAALTGLGVVGGEAGKRLLDSVAADPKSPLHATAQIALARLSGKR